MDILIASSQKHASYASIMQVKKKQILNKTNKKPIIYLANKTLLLYF